MGIYLLTHRFGMKEVQFLLEKKSHLPYFLRQEEQKDFDIGVFRGFFLFAGEQE